jgi:hypothetical protein
MNNQIIIFILIFFIHSFIIIILILILNLLLLVIFMDLFSLTLYDLINRRIYFEMGLIIIYFGLLLNFLFGLFFC